MRRNRRKNTAQQPKMMHSLKELYRIGRGPSSSHTMGPESAAKLFASENPNAERFSVTLYGSLAMTGEGHGTDRVLKDTLKKPTAIVFDKQTKNIPHPNTFDFHAYTNGVETAKMRAMSVGGGAIQIEGREQAATLPPMYRLSTFNQVGNYCKEHNLRLCDYVESVEGKDIRNYLSSVWQTMKNSVAEGLKASGILPGGLKVQRKAKFLYDNQSNDELPERKRDRLVCAYAYAVAEQNAAGGKICTAPTCGACGVVPSVLYDAQQCYGYTDDEIVSALETAGIVGDIIKTNASISGAECGCQAEIGSATSMAAAALGELRNLSIDQIEYAAEIAMEHQLGLTCDPVNGLVQIPCIERNAVAATRAVTSVDLAQYLAGSRKVSFDTVVETMYRTGCDMNQNYRETSAGGLAKTYGRKARGKSNVSRRRRFSKRKKFVGNYTNKIV